MAENLTVEAPDFDAIRRGDDRATSDGVRLLWSVLNEVDRRQRVGIRAAIERWEKKTLVSVTAVSQDNYDTQFATVLRFDGASAINLTGFKARVDGSIIIVLVLGVGTVTVKHNSASSDAQNRILNFSTADKAVATNRSVAYIYEDARWRELSWV